MKCKECGKDGTPVIKKVSWECCPDCGRSYTLVKIVNEKNRLREALEKIEDLSYDLSTLELRDIAEQALKEQS